jgi:hypothetical protein
VGSEGLTEDEDGFGEVYEKGLGGIVSGENGYFCWDDY